MRHSLATVSLLQRARSSFVLSVFLYFVIKILANNYITLPMLDGRRLPQRAVLWKQSDTQALAKG
jgi:hypothetical protein